MVVGLFGAVVWVIAYAIFLLLHKDVNVDTSSQARDTIARFVEENYGSHFVADDALLQQSLHRL
jgi:hypothetical protein